MKEKLEHLRKYISEVDAHNQKLITDNEKVQAELSSRKEVEQRWSKRCTELEKEIEKLKDEALDFYNADRFDNQYDWSWDPNSTKYISFESDWQ